MTDMVDLRTILFSEFLAKNMERHNIEVITPEALEVCGLVTEEPDEPALVQARDIALCIQETLEELDEENI